MQTAILLSIITFGLAAPALADPYSPLPVTISITATINNPAISTNGAFRVKSAPTKITITTKTLLALVASDEHAEGNYNLSVFPSGARLVFMNDDLHFKDDYFIVTDAKGNLILDVSDLLTGEVTNNVVWSGKRNNTTNLRTGEVNQGWMVLTFDDSAAGGTTSFQLCGIDVDKISDTAAKSGLTYIEKESRTTNPALGTGSIGGNVTVLNGSFTASGSTTFSF
jgi:hypothetical protein